MTELNNTTSAELARQALEISDNYDIVEDTLTNSKLSENEISEIDDNLESIDDSYWYTVRELHKRGSDTELELVKKLITSTIENERVLGIDILSQLGYETPNKYREFAMTTFIKHLDDESPYVISSSAFGLGHRNKEKEDFEDFRAVAKLVELSRHEHELVRYGVVSALSGLEHEEAISALIHLSYDDDFDVKNWAVFGIGSHIEVDTQKIRETLHEHLADEDYEVRGEAFVGLAKRQDTSMLELLKAELAKDFECTYAIDSATLLADPCLLPYLLDIQSKKVEYEIYDYQLRCLEDAITACS